MIRGNRGGITCRRSGVSLWRCSSGVGRRYVIAIGSVIAFAIRAQIVLRTIHSTVTTATTAAAAATAFTTLFALAIITSVIRQTFCVHGRLCLNVRSTVLLRCFWLGGGV